MFCGVHSAVPAPCHGHILLDITLGSDIGFWTLFFIHSFLLNHWYKSILADIRAFPYDLGEGMGNHVALQLPRGLRS
jgi:hypothetical protein